MNRPHILIVDDEPSVRMLLAELLTQKGYEVSSAGNVKAAVEVAKRQKFALVLTDERMPGGSGRDLFDQLRLIYTDPVPVLLMTGHTDITEDAERCAGFAQVLVKPFPPRKLMEVIAALLQPQGRA